MYCELTCFHGEQMVDDVLEIPFPRVATAARMVEADAFGSVARTVARLAEGIT